MAFTRLHNYCRLIWTSTQTQGIKYKSANFAKLLFPRWYYVHGGLLHSDIYEYVKCVPGMRTLRNRDKNLMQHKRVCKQMDIWNCSHVGVFLFTQKDWNRPGGGFLSICRRILIDTYTFKGKQTSVGTHFPLDFIEYRLVIRLHIYLSWTIVIDGNRMNSLIQISDSDTKYVGFNTMQAGVLFSDPNDCGVFKFQIWIEKLSSFPKHMEKRGTKPEKINLIEHSQKCLFILLQFQTMTKNLCRTDWSGHNALQFLWLRQYK